MDVHATELVGIIISL